jgi:hypothetical protein
MIEVFSTNISCPEKASRLIEEIHQTFAGYQANFDLSDCDKILRVIYGAAQFEAFHFKNWLITKGCMAEILPDLQTHPDNFYC